MKTLASTALLVLGLTLPGTALAQHMDINEIIAGIGGTDFQSAAARVLSAPAVRVVRLSSLAGAAQAAGRVAGVYDVKVRELNYLQANLYLNPIARHAIDAAGVSIEQIVSIQMPGDGAAVLFADDL